MGVSYMWSPKRLPRYAKGETDPYLILKEGLLLFPKNFTFRAVV